MLIVNVHDMRFKSKPAWPTAHVDSVVYIGRHYMSSEKFAGESEHRKLGASGETTPTHQ